MNPHQWRRALRDVAHLQHHGFFGVVGEAENPEVTEAAGEIGLGDLA